MLSAFHNAISQCQHVVAVAAFRLTACRMVIIMGLGQRTFSAMTMPLFMASSRPSFMQLLAYIALPARTKIVTLGLYVYFISVSGVLHEKNEIIGLGLY